MQACRKPPRISEDPVSGLIKLIVLYKTCTLPAKLHLFSGSQHLEEKDFHTDFFPLE